ncbi:MAG: NAD(P)H-hydrate epimerase [Saprospiraceae bacterium]|nr:NAD(P)H-hydrate epimerase [Saprospiraceae bacterium]
MVFPKFEEKIPHLTTEQMIEVDRLMEEKYQIDLTKMMENAGRSLAILASHLFLKKQPILKRVAVLVGTGGNGGGALAAARRLHNWGADVHVYISKPAGRMTSVPAHQLGILKSMEVSVQLPIAIGKEERPYDLIIDGIIGYNLKGDPRGGSKSMIEWANEQKTPVLAVDTPSGIDMTTGKIHEPSIKADATLTLALPKKGLFEEGVKAQRGALYLADIGVPPMLYMERTLGFKVPPIFAKGDILLLED